MLPSSAGFLENANSTCMLANRESCHNVYLALLAGTQLSMACAYQGLVDSMVHILMPACPAGGDFARTDLFTHILEPF